MEILLHIYKENKAKICKKIWIVPNFFQNARHCSRATKLNQKRYKWTTLVRLFTTRHALRVAGVHHARYEEVFGMEVSLYLARSVPRIAVEAEFENTQEGTDIGLTLRRSWYNGIKIDYEKSMNYCNNPNTKIIKE